METKHGGGRRYRLLALVVMRNDVPALLEQLQAWPLSKVVQSYKRSTSRHICAQFKSKGPGSPSCTRHRPSKTGEWRDFDADARK